MLIELPLGLPRTAHIGDVGDHVAFVAIHVIYPKEKVNSSKVEKLLKRMEDWFDYTQL